MKAGLVSSALQALKICLDSGTPGPNKSPPPLAFINKDNGQRTLTGGQKECVPELNYNDRAPELN
jgi:hypothetical protein